jgi:hypothetical protein
MSDKQQSESDFRAFRRKLPPEAFAICEGVDVPPTDLVDEATWSGLIHLSDDVALQTSDHLGQELKLLYDLWGAWAEATGDPDHQDELFVCMLDATTAFQCSNFLFLHGYYRGALAELRVALELVMIGSYGNLRPANSDYLAWKASGSEFGFTRCRKRMHALLRTDQCKWLLADGEFPAGEYQRLCNFTHSRPDSSDGMLWRSNGPVYAYDAMKRTFEMTMSVYAICYLLVRIARPRFVMQASSRVLFEGEWIANRDSLAKAFKQLYA